MARNSDRPEDARERADRRPAAAVTSQVPVAGSTVPISSPGRTPPDPSKPVQSLRNRADAEPHRAPEAAPHRAPEAAPQPIATAVFVVGSARLEPGRRYSLAIRSNRLLVLGPIDIDPSTVALDRPVADIDVHAVEGRLVISEPRSGSGLALAFMAVTGATTEGIAAQIADAARQGSSQA